MYLFSYFKTDDEAMYLADSEDGIRWEVRNGGKAVLRSAVGTGQLRDPFLIQDSNGIYHALWSDGWASCSIGYAWSHDLEIWQGQKLLPVMESVDGAANSWAPEAYWDTERELFRIIWSSTVSAGDDGPRRDHRIWSVWTKDFASISEPQLFFDPGYNVIDATVTDLGDRYVMLFKDERGTNEPDTDNKAIRLCYMAKDGRDLPTFNEPSKLLTPALSEGPTLYQTSSNTEGERRWLLAFDLFTTGQYAAVQSSDLQLWSKASPLPAFPSGSRHGSVLTIQS